MIHSSRFAVVAIAIAIAGLLSVGGARAASSDQITGNAATGKQDFAICSACHQIGPGAKNAVGPVLNGVIGRRVASYPGYDYSKALRSAPFKVWTVPELRKWLSGPQQLVPGTKMAFPGFTDKTQVNDVIAYLDQFNAKGEKKK